jgi:hypothetical protein
MNYEQKYLKYKVKYLNLLSNQKGGVVELNGIPLIEGDILTYNGQDYTFKGEEKFIVNAKGQTPRHEITRIILDNPTTTIKLEFEKNKDFLQRKTKI